MLSDPISVTYDSVAKSLPRTGVRPHSQGKLVGSSGYNTADGEFDVTIKRYQFGEGNTRVEAILTRRPLDPDGPFEGSNPDIPNSFGIIIETNKYGYNAAVDIPKLRTALLAFVDSTVQGRLIGGEM